MPFGRLTHIARSANANKGRIVRALANTGRNGFWALFDQGLSSLGSFGINIVLARELAVGAYGNFGMLFELMWLLNSIQAGLIIYPMTVKGATLDRAALARVAGGCVFLTALMGPIFGGAALIMGGVLATWQVGAWAALAAVIWQIQETARRGLMAELRFRDAIWGDSVAFIGQVVGVATFSALGWLTLESVFQIMCITSSTAAIIQFLQLKLRIPDLAEIWKFARDGWAISRWMLAGNFATAGNSTLYTINFRYWWGAQVIGIAFALNNLLRLTNPLMFAIISLITPHVARARATEGIARSKRVFFKFAGLGALMLAPYLAALIVFPGPIIGLVLKKPEYQQYWGVLIISAITQGLIYIGAVFGAYLNAVERSRAAFIGQLVYSGIFIVLGMPLTARYGIWGAAMGGLIASVVQVIVNAISFRNVPPVEEPRLEPRGFEVVTAA